MVPDPMPTIEEIAEQLNKNSPKAPDPEPDHVVTRKDSTDATIEGVTQVVEEKEDPIEAAVQESAETEEKPEEKVPPKKDPQAARFAALARREREARQIRQEAEARAKSLEDKERTIREREERLTAAKKHPLDLLKEHGYSYADATQAMLGDYKPKEPDPLTTKVDEKLNPIAEQVKQLKEYQEQINASLQELQRHRVEIAQREVKTAIEDTAKEGGYDFILAAGTEAVSLVQDVIHEHYKKYKRILNYNDACDRVEKYYQERFDKLASAPKVQSRFASPGSQKTPAKPSPATKPAKESPKTLTQSLTTSSTRAKTDVDAMSKAEALNHLVTTLKYID